MVKILVIHGPNLNLLGKREPGIYGQQTLSDINRSLEELAKNLDIELKIIQSNSEGEIVSFIGDNMDWADGIIINPAAYTHTSVAIRDAISATGLPPENSGMVVSRCSPWVSFFHPPWFFTLCISCCAPFWEIPSRR